MVGSRSAPAQLPQRRHIDRILILGGSCTGKSTLGRQLSGEIGTPFVELDNLYWQPGWRRAGDRALVQAVDRVTSGSAWIVDGNYLAVREMLLGRASTIIWLDVPFLVALMRSVRRSITRITEKEVLYSGNRETFKRAFLSGDSVTLWVLRTHFRRRKEFRHLLRSRASTGQWLVEVASARDLATLKQTIMRLVRDPAQ